MNSIDLTRPWTGHVPLGAVARNPEQPRRTFEREAMARLVRSLQRNGQQVPCTVIPFQDPELPDVAWMLVDGERRHRACGLAGLLMLWISYRPDMVAAPHDADQLHSASFMANWCREGHTRAETISAVQREMRMGRTRAEIAEAVGKSDAWVFHHEELARLHPDLLKLMDPPTPKNDRLPLNTALALVKWDHEKQLRGWRWVKDQPGGQQLRTLRVKSVVSAGRDVGDDNRYLLGNCRRIGTLVGAVKNAGEVMLRRIGPERLRAMEEELELQGVSIDETVQRLRAVRARLEEGEAA